MDFDIGELDARDEAELAIKHPSTGEPTTWIWTFYGPGHPSSQTMVDAIKNNTWIGVPSKITPADVNSTFAKINCPCSSALWLTQ